RNVLCGPAKLAGLNRTAKCTFKVSPVTSAFEHPARKHRLFHKEAFPPAATGPRYFPGWSESRYRLLLAGSYLTTHLSVRLSAAFLVALLTSLACPIFNRPTAGSLAGPAWNPQHWRRAAAQDGLPMCAGTGECAPGGSVVVLDRELVAGCDVPAHISQAACRLAQIA